MVLHHFQACRISLLRALILHHCEIDPMTLNRLEHDPLKFVLKGITLIWNPLTISLCLALVLRKLHRRLAHFEELCHVLQEHDPLITPNAPGV